MEGSGIGQFIPLILIFVIFYFFFQKEILVINKVRNTKKY